MYARSASLTQGLTLNHKGVPFVVLQILALSSFAWGQMASMETLGCYHYAYFYSPIMVNASTLQTDAAACQTKCALTANCTHFTFWGTPVFRCDLVGIDAILKSEPLQSSQNGVMPPLSVSGPAHCSSVAVPGGNPPMSAPACEELPNPDLFPGATPAASQAAWPSGEVPTNAQCWPRNNLTGYPEACPVQKLTVLEDTDAGWPGKCEGLTKIELPLGETCESNCKQNILCSVWQVETLTATPECWQGSMGSNCYHRPGFSAARAQRIMHGTYRVLKDLKGIRVMGMSPIFPPTLFPNSTEAAAHCRLYCISALTCQWWQYSLVGGCYAEDVSKAKVAYPLTTDDSQSQTDTDLAEAIVAGEYIQHYCGGDAPSAGTEAARQAYASRGAPVRVTTTILAGVTTTVQVPAAMNGTVAPIAWPTIGSTAAPSTNELTLVMWFVLAMVVVLCIIVSLIAVQACQKTQARQARRKEKGLTLRGAEFDRYSASEFDISESSVSFDHRSRREDSFMEDAPLLQQSFMEMGARPEFGQDQRGHDFGMYPSHELNSSFGPYTHQEQSFGLVPPAGLTPPQGLFPFPQPIRNTASVPPGYSGYPPAF